MIIDVKKYLIIGVQEELDAFFQRAQQQGIAEFIPLQAKKTHDLSLEMQHLLEAKKILRKLPVKNPYMGGGNLFFADEVALGIIDLKQEVQRLSEEKRFLETEILRVAPFGNFSLDDIDFIEKEGRCVIQFFCSKSMTPSEESASDEMIFVRSDYDLDYFVSIQKKAILCSNKIEMRIDRSLEELRAHLGFVKDSLHQIEAELKGYAGHLDFLHDAFLERLNDYNLVKAKKEISFPLENSIFAVEAWVPENKTAILYSIMEGLAIHCERVAVEEQERVPTYMENKGIPKIGEDLVQIYDTPASDDKDPSRWVFWFFVIFFSMIVNDGGYGLIYLSLCLFCKWKFTQLKSGLRRMLRLATFLSVGCVVWGVLTSSFFGLHIDPDSWLGKCSVMHQLVLKKAAYHLEQKDDVYQFWVSKFPAVSTAKIGDHFLDAAIIEKPNRIKYEANDAFAADIFLELSLVVGIIHLSFSLLRSIRRHWAGLGWVIFIFGAYLYLPSILKATSLVNFLGFITKPDATTVGLQVLYTGIITAVLLALLQKRSKGLGEISTLISIFADGLSYLRLYALGLSTAIMAETFNDLGQDVGLFLGVLIILAGHGITILMGMMTGTIHGLRLNFIEWYHYSFHGGGRLFRPLMHFKSKEHH